MHRYAGSGGEVAEPIGGSDNGAHTAYSRSARTSAGEFCVLTANSKGPNEALLAPIYIIGTVKRARRLSVVGWSRRISTRSVSMNGCHSEAKRRSGDAPRDA